MDEDGYGGDRLALPVGGLPDGSAIAAGVLPSPEALERYNAVVPGAAARIFSMAQEQARHRHELEQALAEAGVRRARQAIDAGTAVAVICIVAGFLLVLFGHPAPGVALAVLGVALFVGVFLYAVSGRWPRQRRPLPPAPVARGPHRFDL